MSLNRLRGKRLQARQGSRWTRNTLENTMGLRSAPCPCGALNVYGPTDTREQDGSKFIDPARLWQPPTHCHSCGQPLTEGEA